MGAARILGKAAEIALAAAQTMHGALIGILAPAVDFAAAAFEIVSAVLLEGASLAMAWLSLWSKVLDWTRDSSWLVASMGVVVALGCAWSTGRAMGLVAPRGTLFGQNAAGLGWRHPSVSGLACTESQIYGGKL